MTHPTLCSTCGRVVEANTLNDDEVCPRCDIAARMDGGYRHSVPTMWIDHLLALGANGEWEQDPHQNPALDFIPPTGTGFVRIWVEADDPKQRWFPARWAIEPYTADGVPELNPDYTTKQVDFDRPGDAFNWLVAEYQRVAGQPPFIASAFGDSDEWGIFSDDDWVMDCWSLTRAGAEALAAWCNAQAQRPTCAQVEDHATANIAKWEWSPAEYQRVTNEFGAS